MKGIDKEDLMKRMREATEARLAAQGKTLPPERVEAEAEIVAPVIVNPGKEGRPTLGGCYPPEIKERFLSRVLEGGESLAKVSREMGIARSTCQAWIAEHKEERQEQDEIDNLTLANLYRDVNLQVLRCLDKTKLEAASVRDLAILAGIATDKRAALIGPQKAKSSVRLRVAWRDGSGALEVEA